MSLNTGVHRFPNQAITGTSDTGYSDFGFDASGNPATANAAGTVKYLPQSASAAAAAELAKLGVHGADIASAATLNLESATGELVDVTGTTGITAITLSEGHRRIVRFTGILTLTHGASLVLLGAANLTTAAGDMAVFVGYAAGVVRMAAFARAATAGGADVTLAQITDMAASVRTAAANATNGTGGLVTFGGNVGAAAAASINGVVISAPGSPATLTMEGSIDTSTSGGNIDTANSGGNIHTYNSGGSIITANSGGNIDTTAGGDITTGTGNLTGPAGNGTIATDETISGGTLAGSFTTLAASGAATITGLLTASAGGIAGERYFAGALWDGGGSALIAGVAKGTWVAPMNGTIKAWSISVDAGACTIRTFKIANGTAIPTAANVITTAGVQLTTGTHVRSTTVTDFTTTTVTKGDIFRFDLYETSLAQWVKFELEFESTA